MKVFWHIFSEETEGLGNMKYEIQLLEALMLFLWGIWEAGWAEASFLFCVRNKRTVHTFSLTSVNEHFKEGLREELMLPCLFFFIRGHIKAFPKEI